MKERYLTADIFTLSIKRALNTVFDIDSSLRRLKGSLPRNDAPTINIRKSNNKIVFYEYTPKGTKYLRKKSPQIYKLARQRYCKLLYDTLKAQRDCGRESLEWKHALNKMLSFTNRIYEGNLELERVVLTANQYKWIKAQHKTKNYTAPPGQIKRLTNGGVETRSKSESLIGNSLESYGVPYIYELQMKIEVYPIVNKLQETLGEPNLYTLNSKSTYWKVPPELEWMNSPGSMWKTYYYRDGKITIHPDFSIMLADGELFVWEHEGPSENFRYRCNASERVFVMRLTETVARKNLLFTFEDDVLDAEVLDELIAQRVLSRLWF